MFEATAKKSPAEAVLPPTRETHDENLPTTGREGSGTPPILEAPNLTASPGKLVRRQNRDAENAVSRGCRRKGGSVNALAVQLKTQRSAASLRLSMQCPWLVQGIVTLPATKADYPMPHGANAPGLSGGCLRLQLLLRL